MLQTQIKYKRKIQNIHISPPKSPQPDTIKRCPLQFFDQHYNPFGTPCDCSYGTAVADRFVYNGCPSCAVPWKAWKLQKDPQYQPLSQEKPQLQRSFVNVDPLYPGWMRKTSCKDRFMSKRIHNFNYNFNCSYQVNVLIATMISQALKQHIHIC